MARQAQRCQRLHLQPSVAFGKWQCKRSSSSGSSGSRGGALVALTGFMTAMLLLVP